MDLHFEYMWENDINLSFCSVIDHLLIYDEDCLYTFVLSANEPAILFDKTNFSIRLMELVLGVGDLNWRSEHRTILLLIKFEKGEVKLARWE